ncbi:Peptidoglycan-binding (PGRP) domain of peptidoglycan hydrolases-containing protein [Caloramator fervidus]|uniref:Peptidoglycan-binding (PGRP) domain of peptidoglycan hydrolases-containing protein n=1 Tax=Caloramator fervidus TaxID=29344 RepID=A0A1H5TKB0_9CLOT|nr:peptidoglycan-binding protein [Caloramator fervidus]SEF63203.1 Peptidoglycan-binding (PGRP) domain of peptidoglycan hydrolases-containing protein [Caloramator fervidus]
MLKRIIAFTIVIFMLIPSIVDAAISLPLYYGSKGQQVEELQSNLKSLGYYSSTVDGIYGYETYLAVKKFQEDNLLTPTGNLDLVTLNQLNKVLNNEPKILYYGIRHEKVAELQTYLYALGYLSVQPTGYFGSLTQNAVLNFQKDYGLSLTGQADKAVFDKIFEVIDNKYKPYTTYETYIVQSGDTLWSISQKFKVTILDLTSANGITTSTVLYVGQALKIPKIIVPVKPYYPKYGEYLDWFTQAQYIFPVGTEATVIDYFTGKSFKVKRTTGSGHADVETLTAQDTAIMKEIFGGTWTWDVRPIILVVNGRRIAASMSGMPHAGLDAYPSNINVYNRSGGYGYGPNYDYIKGNNMDGHFDIHFVNSLRHKDWQVDERHQAMIKISANR